MAKAAEVLMRLTRQATRLFFQMQIKSITLATSHPEVYLQINMLRNDTMVSKFLLKLVRSGFMGGGTFWAIDPNAWLVLLCLFFRQSLFFSIGALLCLPSLHLPRFINAFKMLQLSNLPSRFPVFCKCHILMISEKRLKMWLRAWEGKKEGKSQQFQMYSLFLTLSS